MDAICLSEMSANIYRRNECNIPEELDIHKYPCHSIKSSVISKLRLLLTDNLRIFYQAGPQTSLLRFGILQKVRSIAKDAVHGQNVFYQNFNSEPKIFPL